MKGTIAVIVTKSGHVVAAEADFAQDSPAGWAVDDMQVRRATRAAWKRVMDEFCHPDIAKAVCLSEMTLDSVSMRLRADGWTITTKPVELPTEPSA